MTKGEKNIILDMDGTLIDTERMMLKCAEEYAKLYDIECDNDFMLKFVGACFKDIAEVLTQKFGNGFDAVGFLKGFVKRLDDDFTNGEVPVKKGVFELLDYLKEDGWNMALASTTKRTMVDINLEKTGLKKYFSVIVTGDTVKENKPSPEIYYTTCKLIGVKPENCFAVEDSNVGIQSALSAGMKVLAVPDLHKVSDDTEPKCAGIFTDCGAIKEYLCKL